MDALLTRIDAEKKQVAKLKFGYDIETDWTMFTTCNYACDYCFFDAEALGKKLEVFASNEQWQHAFDNTGLTWLIHLTGGSLLFCLILLIYVTNYPKNILLA